MLQNNSDVGCNVGRAEGRGLGAVGKAVGPGVGGPGVIVGFAEGNALGTAVGLEVVGNKVGIVLGEKEGTALGNIDG